MIYFWIAAGIIVLTMVCFILYAVLGNGNDDNGLG